MKKLLTFLLSFYFLLTGFNLFAQDDAVHPTSIITPIAFEITGPLRDNPIVTNFDLSDEEMMMNAHRDRELDPNIFPPDFENMPEDPSVQTKQGWVEGTKATLTNFAGQNSGSYPPDCNGTVGANYYFQVVNTTYAIYNKSTGAIVAGPSPLNSIFNSSLPGANCNSGDPIVLWDEHANKWLYAEFSLCNSNDRMLIAVSQTSDPTGSWYSWSFDVADTPDYMKFGIWQDGYYMATNTSSGNDVYAFDRSTMIAGGASPTMLAFDNPNRPSTFDGFHCILPLDNDGPWAPTGTNGQFITIADNDQSNPSDALYIYELHADWGTPTNSTFARTQIITVNPFYGNFNSSWDNIPQSGTSQKLDGLSTILMYRAQYRNFSGNQRIVCAHAIAKTSSEANLRWYELENTGSGWGIRQQGTYDPASDAISRWNMSIAENGDHEIGIGYSVCNSSMYPGIRYIGQSAASNASANNTLDMAETSIWTGSYYQTTYNRWGDYSNISVDPTDDHVFWYTNEYKSSSSHGTRIASFQFSSPSSPPVADFSADDLYPANSFTTVNFTDLSTGNPTSWSWSFNPSTVTYVSGNSNSQNPSVRFDNPGAYTVSLTATNVNGSDTETKTAYIHMGMPGNWTGATSTDWNTNTNWENHMLPTSSTGVSITPAAIRWPTKTGNLTIGTDCLSLNMSSGYTEITVTGNLTISSGATFYVDPTGIPNIYVAGNWTALGTFTPGQSKVILDGTTSGSVAGPAGLLNIFNDGFESVNGWTLSGEFELGAPTGLGGNYGNPDPTSAYQGSAVLGVDLTGQGSYPGDYEVSLGDRAYQAISPIINCTGVTSVSMNFQRWLNVERDQYDNAYIDISTNGGSSWTNIWQNSNTTITDNSWSLQTIDISSYADNQAQVQIRFCIGTTDGSWQYSGWNIDEFNITGNASLTASFYDLSIEKNNALVSTGSDVDVLHDFNIKANSDFTNSSGNFFHVFNNTILEDNGSNKASYLELGTLQVDGASYVQKYYTDNRWHNVSSPVSGAVSGMYLNMYLYSYDEATDSWFNIVPTNVPLVPGVGYLVWSTIGNPTVSFTGGQMNTGNYSPVMSYTDRNSNSTVDADEGWNMVGNAYPSAIDIMGSGYTWTSLTNTIYMYNGSNYVNFNRSTGSGTTGVTRYIPSMQGFFVKVSATSPAPVLTIPNSARLHDGQANYKSDEINDEIRITVSGNDYSDEMVLMTIADASSGFDEAYDAYKLYGMDEAPQLYTFSGATKMALNTYPDFNQGTIIPIALKVGADGLYTINFTKLNVANEELSLYLEDLQSGDYYQVRLEEDYVFESGVNDETHRFNLHFSSPTYITDIVNNEIKIYSEGEVVYISKETDAKAEVVVYNILGEKIAEDNFSDRLFKLPINHANAYYLVKVNYDNKTVSKKILIK